MLPWYSLASVQMANNLIKWWRTKFLNGYKQFSVIQTETNRLSDTEELLGGNDGNNADATFGLCDAAIPTCSTPPATSPRVSSPTPVSETPQPQETPDKHLNLEEFSCDVSMEGGIYRDGQERQEFSFTLYDFDGHGKITKDDIAGLVTTIYETLGSSVKVPHYGSKTIKVKLTVSPDQGKRMSATVIDHKTPSTTATRTRTTTPAQEENGNNHRKSTSTIKEERHRRQCRRHKAKPETPQMQTHTCCNSITCKDNNNVNATLTAPLLDLSDGDFSDHCSRVSEDEISEDEGECSEDQLPKSCEKLKPRRYQKFTQRHFNVNANNAGGLHAHVPISPVLCTKARRTKKRSSSLQRKELLEIIQANMDKNNHSFQTTSRKQCPNHISTEPDQIQIQPALERKHRTKSKTRESSAAQLQCLANIVNTENCYLELTNLHNRRTEFPIDGNNGCRYDKLFGAVVCIPNLPNNTKNAATLLQSSHMCRNQRHNRSKSHDLTTTQMPFRYHLLETHQNLASKYLKMEQTDATANPKFVKKANKLRTTTYDAEFVEQTAPQAQAPAAAFKKNVKKFSVPGHSSSPHHLKHRNRQEDQARAMAQVVRWLEQEFSSNVNLKKEKRKNATKTSPEKGSSTAPSPNNVDGSPSVSSVERHEHHHVHEHIHHHYHHYQEAPVPVVV